MHTSTSSILFVASLLAASTTAQEGTATMQAVSQIADGQPQAPAASTVAPVSQIEDGQPQAPTASTVAPVSEIEDGQPQAPVTSSPAEVASSYVNPYMSETNSLGVVTGQPDAVTTQPDVITSQAPAATYYSNAPGVPEGLNTTLVPVVSSSAEVEETSAPGNLSTKTASASRTGPSSADSSGTATTSGFSAPQSTNAAASVHLAGTGLALGVAGAFFALLL